MKYICISIKIYSSTYHLVSELFPWPKKGRNASSFCIFFEKKKRGKHTSSSYLKLYKNNF
jgi:hypothetical protein